MAYKYNWYIDQRCKNINLLAELREAYQNKKITVEDYVNQCSAINKSQSEDDAKLIKQKNEQKSADIEIKGYGCEICKTYVGWLIDDNTYKILKSQCNTRLITPLYSVICHRCNSSKYYPNHYRINITSDMIGVLNRMGLEFDTLSIDETHFYPDYKLRVYIH